MGELRGGVAPLFSGSPGEIERIRSLLHDQAPACREGTRPVDGLRLRGTSRRQNRSGQHAGRRDDRQHLSSAGENSRAGRQNNPRRRERQSAIAGQARVLVVEHEESLREIACSWLGSFGYETVAVNSPGAALEQLSRSRFCSPYDTRPHGGEHGGELLHAVARQA